MRSWLRWLARGLHESGWWTPRRALFTNQMPIRNSPDKCLPGRAGKARIAATVTAKSGVGQDIKPHMLWVSYPNYVRLHTQCSNRLELECEDEEGGENCESAKSLAQGAKASN